MIGTSAIVGENDASRPEVSVIVPALNSARTIARCMEALAAQETGHRFEVIVVHSGEDDTCARAQAALPGTRVCQLPKRALAATARNAGVPIARGDTLAFVDSDAYADQTWIDNVVASAATGADLICGSIENANPHSAVSRAEQIVMFSEFFPDTPERLMWFVLSGNLVMQRKVYDRWGPFVEVRAAEDLIFSRRMSAAGARLLFYPKLRVFHDNRQRVRPYLRNQIVLGKYTAIARRVVPFADTSSYWLFVLSVPAAPLAKLAKIVWRLSRWTPRHLVGLVRGFPLIFLGVLAYGLGQFEGVVAALRPQRPECFMQLSEAEPAGPDALDQRANSRGPRRSLGPTTPEVRS